MYHSSIRKFCAVGSIMLFVLLSVTSASTAQAGISVINTKQILKQGPGGGPEVCKRPVRVDAFTVYLFEDPFFEIYSLTGNHGTSDHKVRIDHSLITPDGNKMPISWYEANLRPGELVEFWIFCMYLDQQYGKYTALITVHDSDGRLLDQESFSWVREPSQ